MQKSETDKRTSSIAQEEALGFQKQTMSPAPTTTSVCATASVLITLLLIVAPQTLAKSAFSDADKLEFVVTHNQLRQTASPAAAGMNFVVWDKGLEDLAVKTASVCKGERSYGEDYKILGENIYQGSSTSAIEITHSWFAEKFTFNHTTGSCSYGTCRLYPQIMRDAVQRMGCGIKDCGSGNHIVFCEYSASWEGFYTRGIPCSACPGNRPLCWNDMCVTKEIVGSPEAKAFDSVTSTTSCRLACNCGTRVAKNDSCTCKCSSTLASGDHCEKSQEGSNVGCRFCHDHPECQNGGSVQEVRTDRFKKVCRCNCANDFVGSQCEIDKKILNNSVRFEIGALQIYSINGYHVYLPVSKAKFNTKIWPIIRETVVSAVNSYCLSSPEIFSKCCSNDSKSYEGKDKTWKLIDEDDVMYLESTVANDFAGSIIFMVYSEIPDKNGSFCTDKDRPYLTQSVLMAAIKSSSDELRQKLKQCCNDTMKNFRKSSVADLENACLYKAKETLKRPDCSPVPASIPRRSTTATVSLIPSDGGGTRPKSSSEKMSSHMALILTMGCTAAVFLL